MKKYKNYVQQLKVEIFLQLAFKKLGELVSVHLNMRTVLSLVADQTLILVKSRRGEQGVGILLSKNAVTAWKSAGSIVHNDLGARIIAVRLLVNDNMKNEVGLFLIAAYAPIVNANQKL